MIKRALFISLLVWFPGASIAAETLPVRAGEHGEYSRLVIPSAPDDWRIATSDRKVEIALPTKDYEFELSDILEKRKAHRVLSARIVDGADTRSLVLTLTCDCPVRTSKGSEGSIVIDIFNDGPTPLLPTQEDSGPTAAMQQAARQAAGNQSAESASATPENMRAARDRMIALLAEARHQGVVTLKIDEERNEQGHGDTTKSVDAAKPAEPHKAIEPTQIAHSTPELDPAPEHDTPLSHEARVEPPALTAHARADSSAHCVDASMFDEPLSEEGKLDYSTIAKLRQRLEISNEEQERQDLARTLALAYIHIGFFEEANAIAAPRAADGDENMAVASALSDLAVGANRRAREAITPYASCGPFFEMINAAAASDVDETTPSLGDNHVQALKALTRPLRAPIAEALGLNAIEQGDKSLAKIIYAVAREARGKERTAALAIMEKALGETPEKSTELNAQLTEAAQMPGPLQSKALSLLAEDYEERAEAAYEGFLDDLAQQTNAREMGVSEARASFAGAKALAAAGRLKEGVAVLNASAHSAPKAAPAAQAVARSMIMNALMADDETRLQAIQAFIQYRDFISGGDDADVNIAIAKELSNFGARYLVDDALADVPASWRAQSDLIKARTLLNSGDPKAALDMLAGGQNTREASALKVEAHERLGNNANALAVVKTAIRTGNSDDAMTRAAWRGQNWALAMEAFDKAPKTEHTKGAATRISLAALNAGLKTLPASVREMLSTDPDLFAALAHMFAPAPAVSVRTIDVLADYSTGVAKETNFMQRGLGDE